MKNKDWAKGIPNDYSSIKNAEKIRQWEACNLRYYIDSLYPSRNVIVAGGVAANNGLRTAMKELTDELGVELSIPPMKYCTDNGTMIAAAGYFAYLDGRVADLNLNSKSQDTLK